MAARKGEDAELAKKAPRILATLQYKIPTMMRQRAVENLFVVHVKLACREGADLVQSHHGIHCFRNQPTHHRVQHW